MLHGTLFVIFFTSAVTCNQRFLHGSDIVQYLQNCKCYNVGQGHFRNPLYKVCEKELSLNDPHNFQGPFNFRLLLTFK